MANSKRMRLVVNEAPGSLELLCFGTIGGDGEGGGMLADDIAHILRRNSGRPVNVKINSGGGSAFDGISIYSSLVSHNAEVTTTNISMAGSAAAIISQAASPGRREMYDVASLFVHRAAMLSIGNAQDMREAADWLDTVDRQITTALANRTGRPVSAIAKLLAGDGSKDGTVFSPQQAIAEKFADRIISTRSDGNLRSAENHEQRARMLTDISHDQVLAARFDVWRKDTARRHA
jgi:ATP-dependent protease ClpP protease subunit